jgi:anti-anti-sigma regulatory factor
MLFGSSSDRELPPAAALRMSSAGDPPELSLAGEIDESSYPALVAGLTSAARASRGDLHIDLGAVAYCDLAGLRAIVCATGADEDHHSSRQVILHAVPRPLRTVLRILGWTGIPVIVDEAARPGGFGMSAACA